MPVQLQRAMATEAEAAREARAKVIAAEGEQKSSKALKEAADVISESPIAIQLRYLQALTQVASEKNSTIVFPIPLEMISYISTKTASLFKRFPFFLCIYSNFNSNSGHLIEKVERIKLSKLKFLGKTLTF